MISSRFATQCLISCFAFVLVTGCAAPRQSGTATPASDAASAPAAFPWSSGGGAKVGYIRSDIIAQKHIDYRDADNTLKSESNEWQAEVSRMEADIKTKEGELEELRLILTQERRKELEDALNKARKDLASYKQSTWYDEKSKYMERRKALIEPINAKVNDAIWKVAEAQGIDIVFDTVAGNVVYAKPGLDLTDKVLEELER